MAKSRLNLQPRAGCCGKRRYHSQFELSQAEEELAFQDRARARSLSKCAATGAPNVPRFISRAQRPGRPSSDR
jgi:hypothetical protein